MSDAVLVALITGGFSVLAVIMTNVAANRNMQAQMDKQLALFQQRLADLADRVSKHNNVIDRTYALEQRVTVQDEKIKVANHRIDDLEKK